MPDKNSDAGSHDRTGPSLLDHKDPPGLKRWGIIAIAVALAVAVTGLAVRFLDSRNTRAWTDEQAVQTVQVIKLDAPKAGGELNLPGDIQAFTTAQIHAQVSGYVKKWHVDIGTAVKKGQLLAELDTPELDGQVQQGRANVANAQAAQRLSAQTAQRWDALFQQGAVARQDKDVRDADLEARNAALAAARAGLYSLTAQEGFKRLVAPFDGIVTTRAVDVGALVTTGNSAAPLFTVADQSRLRVYVRVPQNYAAYVQPGMEVSFTVPQHPGREFKARLVASAGAVASATGTMLVQFALDNADGALQPGGYATVKFPVPAGSHGLRIPATALMFRSEGMQVATVDAGNHVRLKTITIQRDLGAAVDAVGVSASDRIVDNPPDSLQEGDPVQVAAAATAPKPAR
jgi:RND family efflux transporter MFP subunit